MKLFVSYRRQDSGANAIGIAQYLEKEFGRKNVYIDVDMQAGAKFPAVIGERLSECDVMLVLIGPEWLQSTSGVGNPRLYEPDDWVRLEIATALRQPKITIIPVLVNGAQLPEKNALPDDIRGLLDHQAATVTLAGFRHEMAGLVRDIREGQTASKWRKRTAALLVATVILGAGIGIYIVKFTSLTVGGSPVATSSRDELWLGGSGPWALVATDNNSNGYFIHAKSLRTYGDRVSYQVRFSLAVGPTRPDIEKNLGVYEDDTWIIDCKRSVYRLAERATYSSTNEVLSRFRFGDPEKLDLSEAEALQEGSILSAEKQVVCDKEMRSVLTSKPAFDTLDYTYLANSPTGNGTVLYSRLREQSEGDEPIKVSLLTRENGDRTPSQWFGSDIRGASFKIRAAVQRINVNCTERKLTSSYTAGYEENKQIVFLTPHAEGSPLDYRRGSILEMLLTVVCTSARASFSGRYEGTNYSNYAKGGQSEQKILIEVKQRDNKVELSFQGASGGKGAGSGTLIDGKVSTMSLHSTVPECPGTYQGPVSFAENNVTWSFVGEDCGGAMKGHGTAVRLLGSRLQ